MYFKFKQAVCLNKKDYPLGVNELSEDVLESLSQDETFLLYKKVGLIESTLAPVTEDLIRKKELASKFLPKEEKLPVEEVIEEEVKVLEEVKEKSSSKKKKR